ncbi:amidohydrolase [bacterium]|nr:amidohydrolase [bacterium]
MIVKNVDLNGVISDIFIKDGIITDIVAVDKRNNIVDSENVFDAENKKVVPSFFNTHTHSAMTLLRGYADDMPLRPWLSEKIWPAEAKLVPEDIYWGTKLACLEMIKTGTTFFNDMYWSIDSIIKAADEMGMRFAVSATFIDNSGNTDKLIKELEDTYERVSKLDIPNMIFTIAPHAIYTVSDRMLKYAGKFAKDHDLFIHTHLSETKKEYDDCLKDHGMKPAFYLDSCGLLTEKTMLAHSVWLDDDEIKLIADRGASVSHNPISNMKLSVGKAFDYRKMKNAGVRVTLGTDGCSSNNNLNMAESMKFASILQKFAYDDPALMSAEECFKIASLNGAEAFGIKSGKIEKGYEADFLVLKSNIYDMTPGFNVYSDIVYSVGNNFVDSVFCKGKLIMEHGKIKGEDEIISQAKKISKKFFEA